MPRKGFVKIKMLENHGGFTVGDIREVKSEAAEIPIADTPATRNEKRIPPKAMLLTPDHPHYEDVPGPDAPAPPIVQVVQAAPTPVAERSFVASPRQPARATPGRANPPSNDEDEK